MPTDDDDGARTVLVVRFSVDRAVILVGAALILWACLADRTWWERHVLALGCATDTSELRTAAVARIAAGVLGTALVVLARSAIVRWISASPRRALAHAVRAAAAVLLALVVSELVLRWRSEPVAFPRDVPAIGPDPHLSRVLVPGTTAASRGGRPISFAVNALGLRVSREEDMPNLSKPSILVVGESIAFGYAVAYEESVPYLVQRATGIETLNAAVSTYANDQAYRRMTEVLGRLERPLAVVTFVVPLQIEGNMSYRREHLALAPDGSLVVVRPAPDFIRNLQLAGLFSRLLPHDDSASRVARAIFIATARDARARGAVPLFVSTNFRKACLHDESGESSLSHRLFAGLDVPHVSVDLDSAWEVPGDGHPDVRGSRALADAIVLELRRAKVTSP